jgi:hypothetical protein
MRIFSTALLAVAVLAASMDSMNPVRRAASVFKTISGHATGCATHFQCGTPEVFFLSS